VCQCRSAVPNAVIARAELLPALLPRLPGVTRRWLWRVEYRLQGLENLPTVVDGGLDPSLLRGEDPGTQPRAADVPGPLDLCEEHLAVREQLRAPVPCVNSPGEECLARRLGPVIREGPSRCIHA
jgi:hypothetical protein